MDVRLLEKSGYTHFEQEDQGNVGVAAMSREKEAGAEALRVVITGGSKGLGYALAGEFLRAGDRVVLCGRDGTALDAACGSLRAACSGAWLASYPCDVADPVQASGFAAFVRSELGGVDRWINNAGTAGARKRPLWELDGCDIAATCATNLTGTMLMCAEALRIMHEQPTTVRPSYHIFNMGFSVAGASFSRSALHHKASKRGVAEVTAFLHRELKAASWRSIGVHEVSPGLVLTDLLLRDASVESQRILAILARDPATVAARLVPKLRYPDAAFSHIRTEPLLFMLLRVALHLPRLFKPVASVSP